MILVVLIFIVFAAVEVPPLLKYNYRRELVFFLLFFAFALTLCILQAAGIKLPSPVKGIGTLLDTLGLHF